MEDRMTDDALRQLHDKATRGEQLTPEQRAQIDAWYTQSDGEEADELSRVASPGDVARLRHQLDEAMSELSAASQRVRELAADNESARREIEELRRQVGRRSTPHPA